ncbi:hypothetical protein DMN91_007808 [Ooceraea biroi]|uniref:LAMP family protein-like protein n=1 Tax=Ooceraea biroi TaxID=2015173 RepID=A0A026WTK7_OOCBI|nr:uncharacterized protein LOC105276361 [Ooceraea biroi]EZA58434.1 LAMP family protein-like protein [Ooceraea biroi]RLU19251.1 hypothetical protein DMN91_007808 [Ooceraea biroi]
MLKAARLSIHPHPRARSRSSSQASQTSPPSNPSRHTTERWGCRFATPCATRYRLVLPVSSIGHQECTRRRGSCGNAMSRRGEHGRAILLLWCVSGIALSVSLPSPMPLKLEEQLRYTTRRTLKVFVDMPTPRTRIPFSVANSELKRTTTMPSTTTTTHRAPSSEQPLYRLDRSNGQACILLQVDALITIKYRTKLGDNRDAGIYVPSDAIVTGNCDNENTVTMSLKWEHYVLSWSFAKTPGGERWYVEKIELIYNSSDKHFEHIDQPNKTIRLSTGQKHSSMLFPTPVGKSYACANETQIPLTDGKNHATVFLWNIKLQPFKFKNNEFAAEFSCTALSARAGRDETAPVAVGSTLAAAVLLTITGYAAYRYFKVKKVKYDTME